jgi:hypothetical protein
MIFCVFRLPPLNKNFRAIAAEKRTKKSKTGAKKIIARHEWQTQKPTDNFDLGPEAKNAKDHLI